MERFERLLAHTSSLAGCLVMTGALIVAVVEADLVGSSVLVAVIVYCPTMLGEVQVLLLNEPPEADQIRSLVFPPIAVAEKVI